MYSNISDSKCIIFNSHHNVDLITKIKRDFPEKKFIHRIDGPMRLYNDMSDSRDELVYHINESISDATVFQSKFSLDNNISLGMKVPKKFAIIPNFCDPKIFRPKCARTKNKKVRLISASFSDNPKKGFGTYEYLDKNLDFSRYEYVFLGRSPTRFKNIQELGIRDSAGVAEELGLSDIYITASENDPCSNSLIEAQTMGLPTIALNSGGHPEIVNENSELFNCHAELIGKINLVSSCMDKYLSKRSVIDPIKITNDYLKFALEI